MSDTTLPAEPCVAIASSTRFYPTARHVAADLQARGTTVHTPRFDLDEETTTVSDGDKRNATRRFLRGLNICTSLYLVCPGGYTGASVCIETGYAAALGLPIWASHPPQEVAIAALVRGIAAPDVFPARRPDQPEPLEAPHT